MSTQITISKNPPPQGVHSIFKLNSGDTTGNFIVASSSQNSANATANTITSSPYMPSQTFTSQDLFIVVSGAVASSRARILIYSDLNGQPNTKLYESADLDCSTTGTKTAITSFKFNAGTTYWLAVNTSSANSMAVLPITSLIGAKGSAGGANPFIGYRIGAAVGSAPLVWNLFNFPLYTAIPFVGITVA